MNQIPKTIRSVITTNAIFITVDLQNILWPMRIMLEIRQRIDQPPASPMNINIRFDSR